PIFSPGSTARKIFLSVSRSCRPSRSTGSNHPESRSALTSMAAPPWEAAGENELSGACLYCGLILEVIDRDGDLALGLGQRGEIAGVVGRGLELRRTQRRNRRGTPADAAAEQHCAHDSKPPQSKIHAFLL